MKKLLLITLVLIACNSSFAQGYKTFTTSAGIVYEIMEFKETYPIDSCLNIEKQNPGWSMPDTAQIRDISSQWFGQAHTHKDYSVSPITIKYDMEGFAFLTSSKAGEMFIEVEMRDPIRKLLAVDANDNNPAYYSLLLIKQKH